MNPVVTKYAFDSLTLHDFAVSKAIEESSMVKEGVNPFMADDINQILITRWNKLKIDPITSISLKPIMERLESEVSLLKNPHPKVNELFFRLAEQFCRLAKACDTRSSFGNTTPVTVQAYTHLCQRWEDETLTAFWEHVCTQLEMHGVTPPLLTHPADIRNWLKNPANAPLLANIKQLRMGHEIIGAIPPEIGFCTQLEQLRVCGNKRLTSIPPEIGLCTQLESVWLSGNQIPSIPPEIRFCNQLKDLKLCYNQISWIPPELGFCTRLERVELCKNLISSVPSEIKSCTNLTSLDLSHNQISSIPLEIGACPQLFFFNIQDNPLLFVSDRDLVVDLKPHLERLATFKNYTCLSSFSTFLKTLTFEIGVTEDVKGTFKLLKREDQCLIFEVACQISDISSEDHLFENPVLLRWAVKHAISLKFDRLSKEDKGKVFAKIYELAQPDMDDVLEAEIYAFEHVLRLIDAMDLAGIHSLPGADADYESPIASFIKSLVEGANNKRA
jgi:hypothetical protein